MLPLLALVPVSVLSFLGGLSLGTSRRGLSMLPPERRSPLPSVPALAWEKFVTVMVVAPRGHASPRGRLGYFGLDARRLADVGFMSEPRKATIGGETGVWVGSWVAPLSGEAFLASAPAQYEALARSMRGLVPVVAPLVGTVVDGRPASLSGLLAAGHLAGREGVRSWAADPVARKKFRATTASFERANGLF
jgi:hypothetical protein